MAYEKVVAVFDTAEHAQNAVRALQGAGFSAADISVVNNDTLDDRGAKVATETGFWHRLFGSDVDLHEAKVSASLPPLLHRQPRKPPPAPEPLLGLLLPLPLELQLLAPRGPGARTKCSGWQRKR